MLLNRDPADPARAPPRSGATPRPTRATTDCSRRSTPATSTVVRSTGIASSSFAPRRRRVGGGTAGARHVRVEAVGAGGAAAIRPQRSRAPALSPAARRSGLPDRARDSSVRILLVGDYPPDPRLGSTKVLLKLREEFAAHGARLRRAAGRRPRRTRAILTCVRLSGRSSRGRAVLDMFSRNGPYDVVDVASAEGLWLAAGSRRALNGAVGDLEIERPRAPELPADARRSRRRPAPQAVDAPAVSSRRAPDAGCGGGTRRRPAAAPERVGSRLRASSDAGRVPPASTSSPTVSRSGFSRMRPMRTCARGDGILYCGSWTQVKGVTYLVDAFASVARSRPVDANDGARRRRARRRHPRRLSAGRTRQGAPSSTARRKPTS